MCFNRIEFLDDNGLENQLINIYPQMKYQTIKGFGGALTDSAGYIYSLMVNKCNLLSQ